MASGHTEVPPCKRGLLEGGAEHRLEDVGLAHEAEVAGVGGVGRAFGVVAIQAVAFDVAEILYAGGGEFVGCTLS